MLDLINWLANNEKQIAILYKKAAVYFRDDIILYNFLESLAADEELHHQLMNVAYELYNTNPYFTSDFILDNEIDYRINEILSELSNHLEKKSLTKSLLGNLIIKAEFSEWNSIFLYVINSLKINIEEYANIGLAIQEHKRKVELYYGNFPEFKENLQEYKNLQPLCSDKILIVDDNAINVELLANILEKAGEIDRAYDGMDAFIKIKENSYKLIISDIDMPKMDGITFFEKSSELYPEINEMFIFFTASISDERLNFFNNNKIEYIEKPERIDVIREKAMKILKKDNSQSYLNYQY